MINVALLGKKYQDYIFYLENISIGETVIVKLGSSKLSSIDGFMWVILDFVYDDEIYDV